MWPIRWSATGSVGSAAHNTVRIDGRDQAVPGGPFRWNDKPSVKVREWSTGAERDYLDASCAYAGFTHRRRVVFLKPATVIVLDTVDGPPGDHTLEQFWHLDSPEDAARFSFSAPVEVADAWRSRALGSRERARALCVKVQGRAACSSGGSAGSLGVPGERRGGSSDGGGRNCGGPNAVRPRGAVLRERDRYTLLSMMRWTFRRRSTSWRGSSKAEAICAAPSPWRCMRRAWERLLRLRPGLGSPAGGATGG